MRFLPLAVAFLILACGDAEAPGSPNGTAGTGTGGGATGGSGGTIPETGPCAPVGDPEVEIGVDSDGSYVQLEPGDAIEPFFGSQAGMQVDLLLHTTGLGAGTDSTIELDFQILVDDAPIAIYQSEDVVISCAEDGSGGRVVAKARIDVSDHPTVTSVAVLDGRQAVVDITLRDGDRREAHAALDVVIAL